MQNAKRIGASRSSFVVSFCCLKLDFVDVPRLVKRNEEFNQPEVGVEMTRDLDFFFDIALRTIIISSLCGRLVGH
jgi:hypothetical protein